EAALHTSVCDGILLPKTFEIDVPVDEGAGQRGSDWHSLSCQHVPTPVHSQGSTPKGPSLRLIAARRTIISGTLSDVGQRSGCAICSEFSTNGASRNQLLPDSLRRCVGAIASSQFGLRLLEVAAHCFFADAKALGDLVASHPQRYQPQDRELARRYTRLVGKALWAVADHLFQPRGHEPRGGDQKDPQRVCQQIAQHLPGPIGNQPSLADATG